MKKASPYLRQLLLLRSEWMEDRLMANAAKRGYADITPAMARLFAYLAGKPVALSDLARKLSVSRQAVHKLALESARMGYVEFITSDTDARVKLLKFTTKGRNMSLTAENDLIEIERVLGKQLGSERMHLLKEALAAPWSSEDKDRRWTDA